nr:ComEC/Rec2 family competence protein [Candidatus Krumholzibacteria bacterium]
MPLLEQRRQPRPASARSGLTPAFLSALTLHWALAWSVAHLIGTLVGKTLAGPGTGFPGAGVDVLALTRMSGLLALGLVVGSARVKIPVLLLILSLGIWFGWAEQQQRTSRPRVLVPDPHGPSQYFQTECEILVRATSWPAQGAHSWQGSAVVVSDGDFRGTGMLIRWAEDPPVPGEVRAIRGLWEYPSEGDLPGSFDYRAFLAGRGLTRIARVHMWERVAEAPSQLRLLERLRSRILFSLGTLLPPREAQLASAVLLGARTPGSREQSQDFADLGLAHLFAVSGLHVGVLMGLVMLPGHGMGWGPWPRVLPVFIFLILYSFLTGLPGSVVRAAGLGIVGLLAGPLGRRAKPLQVLGLIFLVTTVYQPYQVLDAGVRLSYLAVGGIFLGIKQDEKAGSSRPWGEKIFGGLRISLAAQWSTLPQAALSFGRISMISPLANLLVVPLFGVAVWLVTLALVTFSFWPWLGEACAAWAFLVFRGLEGLVAVVAGRGGGWNLGLAPTDPGLLLLWLLLTGFLLSLPRLQNHSPWGGLFRGLAALLLIIAGHGAFAWSGSRLITDGRPVVWQFDVGQGDASLVRFPDGASFLIDTGGLFGFSRPGADGPLSRSLIPFLRRAGCREFQAVVLTHGHLDHTGGVGHLDAAFPVKQWWTGGDAAQDIQGLVPDQRVGQVAVTEILYRQGDWKLVILHPEGLTPSRFHENDHSLVTALFREERPVMVWSGDLEVHGEKYLLENTVIPERAQVWKAGHHGSDTSGSAPWLDRLSPSLILVSCGTGNRYGHPSHGPFLSRGDTLSTLRTDLDGSIQLRWRKDGTLRWQTRSRQGRIPASP